MGVEIERKFLLRDKCWRPSDGGVLYRQGYLSLDAGRSVRIRIANEQAWLTIKGKNKGRIREEFEYAIPAQDAMYMLDHLCLKPLIEKTRYRIDVNGLCWEIDEFFGENAGLVLAEVELDDPDQEIPLPDWIGEEVTDDPRYYNASLVKHPYTAW